MTVQEALEILHGDTREDALYQYDREDRPYILARAEIMAIKALEEVEQYRALGTVEELKEAREKQIAKKPLTSKEYCATIVKCPNCNGVLYDSDWYNSTKKKYFNNICLHCGQKLTKTTDFLGRWGEEDD